MVRVDRKGKKRPWLMTGPWLFLFLLGALIIYWLVNREPPTLTLKYGELIEILSAARDNPAVTVRKVRVGHNDIRGEIVLTDPISDGKTNEARSSPPKPFRTMRLGLENDQ